MDGRDPTHDPPSGYRLRPPRRQDAPIVAALRTACEICDEGEATTDAAELAADWRCLPRFDLERDAWVIEAVAGGDDTERITAGNGIVAFAWLRDEEEHRVLVGEYSIHPDARGRGLDTILMDRIEARARQHAALAPDREATLDVFAPVACADKLALFAGRGYRKVREFARMHIDLTEPVPLPTWPDGLTVRTFRRGKDEAAVHDAMDEAFREHFRATSMSLTDWCGFLYGNPRFDPGLWTVTWDGGQVAGACLGYYYPDRQSGYIDELGVLPAWRRRGLGSALLLATLASLRERGARDAVLGVDTRNVTGALHVYEAAGMTRRLLTHVYTRRVPVSLLET